MFHFCTEYPLNPKSRSPRMLVIKKGSTKDLQISGFPVVGSLHSQPVKNGTGTSVYKGLVPKPATPPAKVSLNSGNVNKYTSNIRIHLHLISGNVSFPCLVMELNFSIKFTLSSHQELTSLRTNSTMAF